MTSRKPKPRSRAALSRRPWSYEEGRPSASHMAPGEIARAMDLARMKTMRKTVKKRKK